MPPGNSRMSGFGTSAYERSTLSRSIRVSVAYTPGSAATKSTCAPGMRHSTSYGPTASSAVKRSNSAIAICIWCSSRVEPVSVGAGAHAQPAVEGAAHGLDGAEAAVARHCLELLAGGLEPQPRVIDPQCLDVGAGRHANFAGECAGEVALAHVRARGEGGHREVGADVRRHPLLQLSQRAALGDLCSEVRAELRLAAGALDEHDEPARGFERRGAAEVVLHEGERQIHPGSHARGGPDVAVAHE